MRYLLLFAALPLLAEVTDTQRAEYWKAQAEVNQLLLQLTQAKAKAEAAVAKMKTACGDKQLSADAEGNPVCVDQPKDK